MRGALSTLHATFGPQAIQLGWPITDRPLIVRGSTRLARVASGVASGVTVSSPADCLGRSVPVRGGLPTKKGRTSYEVRPKRTHRLFGDSDCQLPARGSSISQPTELKPSERTRPSGRPEELLLRCSWTSELPWPLPSSQQERQRRNHRRCSYRRCSRRHTCGNDDGNDHGNDHGGNDGNGCDGSRHCSHWRHNLRHHKKHCNRGNGGRQRPSSQRRSGHRPRPRETTRFQTTECDSSSNPPKPKGYLDVRYIRNNAVAVELPADGDGTCQPTVFTVAAQTL